MKGIDTRAGDKCLEILNHLELGIMMRRMWLNIINDSIESSMDDFVR